MRNRWLRKSHAFLNVPRAQSFCFALLERLQNPTPCRIGYGVQGAIERCIGSHGCIRNSAEIDECQYKKTDLSLDAQQIVERVIESPRHRAEARLVLEEPNKIQRLYFFRIGLYPSAINRVRIASASLISTNGPTCT